MCLCEKSQPDHGKLEISGIQRGVFVFVPTSGGGDDRLKMVR